MILRNRPGGSFVLELVVGGRGIGSAQSQLLEILV